jgi:nitrogen fixation protein FixH
MTVMTFQRRLLDPTLSWLAFGILGIGLWCLVAGRPASAGSDENFFTHLHTERAMANVTISPGRVGPVEIAIQLETMEERPLTAKAVSVTLTNAQTGVGLQTVQAARRGDDQWLAKMSVPKPGRWVLGLGISISDTDKVSVESPIVIRQ